MYTKRRSEAFKKACAQFGPYKSWNREQHLAYGLIRGVEYSRMEPCANNKPRHRDIATHLYALGAWDPSFTSFRDLTSFQELCAWVWRTLFGTRTKTEQNLIRENAAQLRELWANRTAAVMGLVEWVPKKPRVRMRRAPKPEPAATPS